MNLKAPFSWIGLVILALPMLINIAYIMFPPAGKTEQTAAVTYWMVIFGAAHLTVSHQSSGRCLLCAFFHKVFQKGLTSNQSVTILWVTDWLLR